MKNNAENEWNKRTHVTNQKKHIENKKDNKMHNPKILLQRRYKVNLCQKYLQTQCIVAKWRVEIIEYIIET
jgi:hypothetical protein